MNIKNTAIIFGITVSFGISNLNFGVGCGGKSKIRTDVCTFRGFVKTCTQKDVFDTDNGIIGDVGANDGHATTNRECTCYAPDGNDKGYVKIRGSVGGTDLYSCTKRGDLDFANTKGWYKVPVWSDNDLVDFNSKRKHTKENSMRALVPLKVSVDTRREVAEGKVRYNDCMFGNKNSMDCQCRHEFGECWISCEGKEDVCSRGCNSYVVDKPECFLKEWKENGY